MESLSCKKHDLHTPKSTSSTGCDLRKRTWQSSGSQPRATTNEKVELAASIVVQRKNTNWHNGVDNPKCTCQVVASHRMPLCTFVYASFVSLLARPPRAGRLEVEGFGWASDGMSNPTAWAQAGPGPKARRPGPHILPRYAIQAHPNPSTCSTWRSCSSMICCCSTWSRNQSEGPTEGCGVVCLQRRYLHKGALVLAENVIVPTLCA